MSPRPVRPECNNFPKVLCCLDLRCVTRNFYLGVSTPRDASTQLFHVFHQRVGSAGGREQLAWNRREVSSLRDIWAAKDIRWSRVNLGPSSWTALTSRPSNNQTENHDLCAEAFFETEGSSRLPWAPLATFTQEQSYFSSQAFEPIYTRVYSTKQEEEVSQMSAKKTRSVCCRLWCEAMKRGASVCSKDHTSGI